MAKIETIKISRNWQPTPRGNQCAIRSDATVADTGNGRVIPVVKASTLTPGDTDNPTTERPPIEHCGCGTRGALLAKDTEHSWKFFRANGLAPKQLL